MNSIWPQDVLGIIEHSIGEHQFARDLSAADFLESEIVCMSEFGGHIIGSPEDNDVDQAEARESTENCAHCEIIAQDELESFQLPYQQPKDN